MSLHFGPPLVLTGKPRPRRVCIKAQRKGPIKLLAHWQTGCSKMAIRRQDICIAQHDDVTIQIDMLNDDGNPLDVSGFQSLTWVIAESVRGTILVSRTTLDGGMSLPSATRGVVVLTNAVTGALPAKSLYHELRGINSGGEYQTMVAGKCRVQDTRISDT